METKSTLENEAFIQNKMDEEKKQLMYKIFYSVCSVVAVLGIPYLFYVAAIHFF